ncbi:MAG: glutamate racemase [Gammaproteobacteria bacterium]
MSTQPIGVFDSGVGGLTVLRALRDTLPHENFLYLGDTARVPYGNKSASTIQRYALEATHYLIKQNIKLLVVGCNTVVSADSLVKLHMEFPELPIIGVIEPGALRALQASKTQQIGVLATRATLRSGAYTRTIKKYAQNAEVFIYSAPLLVPLAEEGWLSGEVATQVVQKYLQQILAHSIDCLLLGCTHYPLFVPLIQSLLPEHIALVDSATTTAHATSQRLQQLGIQNPQELSGSTEFYVTDDPLEFSHIGRLFLGEEIVPQTVHLTGL